MDILLSGGDGRTLAVLLEEAGQPLDLRCGGHGSCNRCRVQLLSGVFQSGAEKIEVQNTPVWARACETRLLSEQGRVAVPEAARAVHRGRVLADWEAEAYARRPETVVAVDIGTTTIAGAKIRNGEVISRASTFNRQSRFGDNVIARINHASGSAANLEELRRAVLESVEEVLTSLGIDEVERIAIAGNTVMSSLFHGIDPTPIGVMPFEPLVRKFPVVSAAAAGLPLRADVQVWTVPAISGFVGGDLTAGLAEVVLQPGEMLVDIGTNCEMIFRTDEALYCTAAAAGPAFEGAGIACGSRAVPGAMDRYFGTGRYSVLGGGEAKGLCGSAMVDFLAVERRNDHLSEFGRFQPAAGKVEPAPGVWLTEGDVEQLLKAKAAVFAGIQTLSSHCGMKVSRIHLAGGFARYLALENAVAIGMLPDCEFHVVGNTSLAGALRLAVEPERLSELELLSDKPVDLPLNTLDGFEDNFIDALLLP